MAMSTCDAAFVGRIFSHLHHPRQIDTMLFAVQENREARVEAVFKAAARNIFALSLPPGVAEGRDAGVYAQATQGLASLGNVSTETSEEMREVIERLFGYDAEDEADEWWMRWGAMQERAGFDDE